MTRKQADRAKLISVHVWEYVVDHPEIDTLVKVPDELYSNAAVGTLPIHFDLDYWEGSGASGLYDKWLFAKSKSERKRFASLVLGKIYEWEPKVDEDENLHRCPFCGNRHPKEFRYERIPRLILEGSTKKTPYFRVGCSCGAAGPLGDTKRIAITKWNNCHGR